MVNAMSDKKLRLADSYRIELVSEYSPGLRGGKTLVAVVSIGGGWSRGSNLAFILERDGLPRLIFTDKEVDLAIEAYDATA